MWCKFVWSWGGFPNTICYTTCSWKFYFEHYLLIVTTCISYIYFLLTSVCLLFSTLQSYTFHRTELICKVSVLARECYLKKWIITSICKLDKLDKLVNYEFGDSSKQALYCQFCFFFFLLYWFITYRFKGARRHTNTLIDWQKRGVLRGKTSLQTRESNALCPRTMCRNVERLQHGLMGVTVLW